MYPKLNVNKQKLAHNIKFIHKMAKDKGIDICCVTKGFCAHPEIVDVFYENGIREFADSRIENLQKINYVGIKRYLLRLPMISEAKKVVMYSDMSLNSEIETVKALGREACRLGITHKVLLMIDVGDLREGVRPENAVFTAKEMCKVEGIKLFGVGMNVNCYGGVLPTETNIGELVNIAEEIEKECNVKLEIISGGNSGSVYLMLQDRLDRRVNNLRIGELVFCGAETSFQQNIEGMFQDVFTLEAEVIEVKDKPSLPIGEMGLNAFGESVAYEDKGVMKRCIIACGRQDISIDNLFPINQAIKKVGSSSDHTILDVTMVEDIKVGDILEFRLNYGAILSLTTSEYVGLDIK